jgi:hypothetical protein
MIEGVEMMRRIFRLSAVLLCIGLATFVLAGCFGASDDSTDTTTTPVSVPSSGATVSTIAVATTVASGLVDRDGQSLPALFVNALEQRPILVLFYVPGQVDDEKVLSAARDLQSSFSGYAFLMYDYRIPAAYGDLSTVLGVNYPPEIRLIDRHGNEQWAWSGYVDKASLNQSLINLGRY